VKRWLRWWRGRTAVAIGATIAAWPRFEPAFVRIGRWIAERSFHAGTVYWFSQDDLIGRLRVSGRRFRRLAISGLDVAVDVTDGTGRLHYFYGQPYEPELARAVAECLSDGDVFIDVGANVGFFSVLAGKRVGRRGAVIAFEPHPGARGGLHHALAENGLGEIVEICDAALGAECRPAQLFLSDDSVLSTIDPSRAPARDDYAFRGSITVAMITLDDWLTRHPDLGPRVRAIKIDVEGTEGDVVVGMAGTLLTCPPAHVFCETAPGSVADQLLRTRGYRAVALDLRKESFGNYWYTREPAARAISS